SLQNPPQLLYHITQNTILQLLFSYPQTQPLHFNQKINLLPIQPLTLPPHQSHPPYYTHTQPKTLSIIIPLPKYSHKFPTKHKTQKTPQIFHQPSILPNSPIPNKLSSQSTTIPPSYNNPLIYITQFISHVTS
ncbi:ATP-binding protein, partial [Bacillus thuringiensis]|uniref:ATP-binding protein n=1 Tax=Bacillus thuringiensis TaxID=1428 RepID=UPI0011A16472